MIPHEELASTKYCLANPGSEYLFYLPSAGTVAVDLSSAKGPLSVEWFNPSEGAAVKAEKVAGGEKREFTAPFGGDAVLYLVREDAKTN